MPTIPRWRSRTTGSGKLWLDGNITAANRNSPRRAGHRGQLEFILGDRVSRLLHNPRGEILASKISGEGTITKESAPDSVPGAATVSVHSSPSLAAASTCVTLTRSAAPPPDRH